MAKAKAQCAHYSCEFKKLAVVISNHPKICVTHVAQALGIHPVLLTQWRTGSGGKKKASMRCEPQIKSPALGGARKKKKLI